jgi:hypothetical protein
MRIASSAFGEVMNKTVAIHQPNFFPWLGFFDKIRQADVFVFLDDAQYKKTGGSWSNRVQILVNGKPCWVTAPIDRTYHGTREIRDMRFSPHGDWRGKFLKTICSAYGKAPHFREVMETLEGLIANREESLAEYNISTIQEIAKKIGLGDRRIVRSSSYSVQSTATQRLVDLTRRVGGQAYLCGGGAGDYQNDLAFSTAGLKLIYQRFESVPYDQRGAESFVSGLSIIDAAMNLGWDGVTRSFEASAGV